MQRPATAPSSFLIKAAWFLTQARWLFGTLVDYLLSPLVWIRFLILAPTLSRFTGLSGSRQNKPGVWTQYYHQGRANLAVQKAGLEQTRKTKKAAQLEMTKDLKERGHGLLCLFLLWLHLIILFDCHPNPHPLFMWRKDWGSCLCLEPGTRYPAYVPSKHRSTREHRERTSNFFCFKGPYRLFKEAVPKHMKFNCIKKSMILWKEKDHCQIVWPNRFLTTREFLQKLMLWLAFYCVSEIPEFE